MQANGTPKIPRMALEKPKSVGESAQRSQTLVRGLEIVESVTDGPASIAEIAERTGLTYSTVHRIVSVLVEQRYLKANDARNFALGPRLIELGFAAYGQLDLVRQARPPLEELSNQTRDTVHLARREDGEVTYLDKLPGMRSVQISSRIGGRKPMISTGVGKAMLLDLTEAELRALYRRDVHLMTHLTPEDAWMGRMLSYQAGGYAFDLGEDDATIRCVAAPLRDATQAIVAAISVSSTTEHMNDARMHALIEQVKEVAAAISAELGYRSR